MLGAQTSSAQVESLRLPIYNDSGWVNIRHPATVGVAFGVAHVMTELRGFSTQVTLQYLFSIDW